MASRYMLNRKMWVIVETVYAHYKDKPFTVHDISDLIRFNGRVTGHLLGGMPQRGIIERHGTSTNPPTYWQFTPKFRTWYETKYLPGLIADGMAIPTQQ